ncbi:hypothetical protein [Hyphomonas sp. KY3]|uniref:hypothetical protein n=1 Tax=Hyphomonas sp. KY3 TaxID=2016196 RepID=UPI001A8D0C72|nr:hypothetical protein [Hyphomonas sp. KY3]
MLSEQTVAALLRLSRGKYALDKSAMQKLIKELQATSSEEIVDQLFAAKPKKKRARQPAPEWLSRMQKAQKKIAWKASEAVLKLYTLAEAAGFQSDKARKKSFPAAAKEVAGQLGESQTEAMFVDWVNDFTHRHKMI